MSRDPALAPFESVLWAIESALSDLPEDKTSEQVADAVFWINRAEALRELVSRLRPPVSGVSARIRELLTPRNLCAACDGSGEVFDPGFYVPGEQFVEPPSLWRCEDCLGTGSGEVAVTLNTLLSRIEVLES